MRHFNRHAAVRKSLHALTHRLALLAAVATFAGPSALHAQAPLTVVSAGPTGEVASLEQANEIRVRFSEPMIAIGAAPTEVAAPFFTVQPPIAGSFRWAGPTILVFTPNPATRLPLGTNYQVTIAASAAAPSGRRLQQAYTFTFTTPTVRLLSTRWYRNNVNQPAKIILNFNQPIDAR